MKFFLRIACGLLVGLCCLLPKSQAQNWIWAENGTSGGTVDVLELQLDSAKNSYVFGTFQGTVDFGDTTLSAVNTGDYFIAKYSGNGEQLWVTSIEWTNGTRNGFAVDGAGNAYINSAFAGTITVGGSSYTSMGGRDLLLVKVDPNGNVLWAAHTPSTSDNQGTGVAADANGNVYQTGWIAGTVAFGSVSLSAPGGTVYCFIVQYDNAGVPQWGNVYGNTTYHSTGSGLAVDAGGNAYVCGWFSQTVNFGAATLTETGAGPYDGFLLQLNALGTEQWAVQVGGSGDDACRRVRIGLDGDVYVGGYYGGTSSFGTQSLSGSGSYLARCTPAGAFQWAINVPVENDFAVGETGLVHLATDAGVQQYSATGSSLGLLSTTGTTAGGMDVGHDNRLYFGGHFTTSATIGTFALSATGTPLFVAKHMNCALSTNALLTDVLCNGDSTGSIAVSPANGCDPYTYLWSNGATTATISSLPAGTYSISITDADGCAVDSTTTVAQPAALSHILSISQHLTCGADSNGAASINVVGGVSPYTYLWSNGESTSTAFQLPIGTNYVTITDNNGCAIVDSVALNGPPALHIDTAVVSDVLCNGAATGSIVVIASGGSSPFTFDWSNAAAGSAVANLAAGSYTLTLTDASSCTNSAAYTVGQNAQITNLFSGISGSTCANTNNGAATANPGGGQPPYSIAWANGGTDSTNTVLSSGYQSLVITDSNACTLTDSVLISAPAVLQLTTSTLNNVLCNGDSTGSITIASAGGTTPYTYNWSTGDTTSAAGNLGAGSYNLTVLDANGCSDSSGYTIVEPSPLSNAFTAVQQIACAGDSNGSATAIATGGTMPYSYLWSNGSTDSTATALPPGYTTIAITDSNNCTQTDSVLITEPALLQIGFTAISGVLCQGDSNGSATAIATSGTMPYSYLWSNGSTDSTANALPSGYTTIALTDSNNCTLTDSVLITEPALLQMGFAAINSVLCHGDSTGFITVTGSGGTLPYSFAWSNGVDGATNSALVAGSYTVMLTDTAGCTDSATYTVSQPSALMNSFTGIADPLCYGTANGTATANPAGGTAPYTFLWSNGGTDSLGTGLDTGTNMLSISDANGCLFTDQVSLAAPDSLQITLDSLTDVDCFGDSTGAISVSVVGGTPGYAFSWSNGALMATASGLTAGTHSITVTDDNGCQHNESYLVEEMPAITSSFSGVADVLCFGDSNGTATVNAAGGLAPYQFLWSTGDTTASSNLLPAGTATVAIADALGCTLLVQVQTGTPNALTTGITSTADSTECSGTATALPQGGTAPYSFDWDTNAGGQTTPTALDLCAGQLYCVIVSDANGCMTDTCTSIISTGMEVASRQSGPAVYPNPASSVVTIAAANNEQSTIQLLDLSGRVVLVETGSSPQQLNVAALARGSYLLRIQDSAGTYLSKIILQ